MNPLLTALRRKFKSPEAALKALGLDASLLKPSCRDDDETEVQTEGSGEGDQIAKLFSILKNRLNPEELEAAGALIRELIEAGSDDQFADDDGVLSEGENEEQRGTGNVGKQTDPDPRTASTGFPKFREPDPTKEVKGEDLDDVWNGLKGLNPKRHNGKNSGAGESRSKIGGAMDAGFRALVPNVERIVVDGTPYTGFKHRRRRPMSAAELAEFNRLFPNLSRVGVP